MSPRRESSLAQLREAARLAAKRVEEAEQRESVRDRIRSTEPPNRRIVRFSGTFSTEPDAKVYSFVAIRADHYRGMRRWFVSQNFAIGREPVLPSPATWVQIVEFAVPGSIYVAPAEKGWKPIGGLPTATSIADQASPRVTIPRSMVVDFGVPHDLDFY